MKSSAALFLLLLATIVGCSNDDSAATGPDQTLRAPSDFKAVRVGLTAIRLTWTDNTESEEGFAVERRIGQGLYAEQLFTSRNVPTAIDSLNLQTGNTYSYRVRAVRYSDRGEYSPVVSVTLSIPYP